MADAPFEKIAFQFDIDEERDADVFVRWGFERVAGDVVGAFVGLELEVSGHRFTILHYDNSHGQEFHRHSAAFPHSGSTKTDLSAWAPNQWVSTAKDEIIEKWRDWVNSGVPIDVKGYIEAQEAAGPGAAAPWSEDED